jgi:phosphoserine phosphatase
MSPPNCFSRTADIDEREKAVIFDFDGVLVNSELIALAELRKCLEPIC